MQKSESGEPVLKRDTCWLQVVSHLSPQYGGIASSVPRLAKATESVSQHSCPIVGFCEDGELAHVPQEQRDGMKVVSPSRLRWIADRGLRHRMKRTFQSADGIHIHGVWESHCFVATGLARDCRRPYVISVHGMLEQWALRHKRIKKALYAALIEIRRMQQAACLRALSIDEVDDYRRLGLTKPIAIIPNGIDEPPCALPELFRSAYPELDGKRLVLFLGRLHKKKGLPMLLEAWSRVVPSANDIHLVIAGPDSDNSMPQLDSLCDEFRLRDSVTFTGMLSGEQKWSALAAASLFVLPSYSEGFSMAVLEAMASGLPVLVTNECHIPEVAAHECGWVISPTVEALERILMEFPKFSRNETEAMGDRGRKLVNQRFHSAVVGKQLAQVYDWLGGGNRPANVEIV